MKIEEAVKRIEQMGEYERFIDEPISKVSVLNTIRQINQPKPVVPQVAIDYYNEYKNVLSSFDEWFCGFYDDKFDEEFEKAEELRIWLYDNDNKINLQHELALATLIVNGPDAVIVEKEKLYNVNVLGCTLFKMTSDNHVRYKLIGKNETPPESKFDSYEFEANLTEKEIKQADERLWQFAKSAF